MIRHSVIFRLKANAGERQFFDEVDKLAELPGIRRFEVLKQISLKNPFDFGISMEFDTQEIYDAYSNHPDHVRFVENFWIPNVEDFLEIDYLIP